MKIIGTDSLNYNQLRNYAGLKIEGYEYKKVHDAYKFINHTYFRLLNKPHPFFHYFFKDFGFNKVDLFHFFNTVYFGHKPWVVTFENDLPRHNPGYLPGLRAMAKDNCLQTIAFCERAFLVQQFLLEKQDAPLRKRIMDKTIILQPSQQLHVQSMNEKQSHDKFTFSFVGVDFYRKGGQEVLLAAQRLIKEGYVFELNIISKLKKGEWKDAHIGQKDFDLTAKILEENKRFINHVPFMNNAKVIELFKRTDVMLLPSYGESYGYVVLEAQACGTPVVTTNMPPFTEFNNNEVGWLCDVPLVFREGIYDSDVESTEGLKAFCNTLAESVYSSMKDALDHPEKVKLKGAKGLDRIRLVHNPANNISKLLEIYQKA